MHTRLIEGDRRTALRIVALAVLLLVAWMALSDTAEPVSASTPAPMGADTISDYVVPGEVVAGTIFARYEGIDGESNDANHNKWIDIIGVHWGISQETSLPTEMTRRRGTAAIEDLVLQFEYEKSAPKLEEKLLKGQVIPKLEIEFTAVYGGARATYLKYELTNVMLTSFSFTSYGNVPVVEFANSFEEIKVTYTEYDETGSSQGNVEYEFKLGG